MSESGKPPYSWLLRILWFVLGHHAKTQMIRQAKRKGVAAYVRVVQGTRRALLGMLLLYFFLQIIVLAGVGAVVTGLWLWDYDPHVKMQIAFGICLGFFFLPALLLMVVFSERLWYKHSGAKKMVDELIEGKSNAA